MLLNATGWDEGALGEPQVAAATRPTIRNDEGKTGMLLTLRKRRAAIEGGRNGGQGGIGPSMPASPVGVSPIRSRS